MAPGQKTVVVGAGPVGALAALYAANRGDDVEIYELRGDLRDPSTIPLNFTRSINLALSERGINSMRHADRPALLEAVLGDTIPMHGRMVHGQRLGQPFEQSQKYDVHGRFIRAVDRAGLNKRLLDELERMPNVKFFFNHKLTGADFRKKTAWFERRDVPRGADNRGLEIEVQFDFMIGADGAHSAVRFHLMKFSRVSYQQEYVETLWCEFNIAAGDRGSYKISPNHLHIWPAGEFMFIALPSTDGSFTCTLFLSEEGFKKLDKVPDTLIDFFKSNFPGVVDDLIPADELKHQYATNPHLPLISIKCAPYHYNSSVVILGDAAHAMVPFYGQGMNAGLEDVRVLYEFLDDYLAKATTKVEIALARGKALEAYTDYRAPDAAAINDLAMGNYGEMRSDVRSPTYKLRKWIEEWLYNNFPQLGWATQYSRVSFGNERYSEVEKASERQKQILINVIYGSLSVGVGLSLWTLRNWHQRGGSLPVLSRIFRR